MSIFGFDDMIELYANLDEDQNIDGLNVDFLEFPETVLQCIISHSELRDRFSMSLVCRLLHDLELKTELRCDLLEIRSRSHTQDGISGEIVTVIYQNMKLEKFTRRWEDWEISSMNVWFLMIAITRQTIVNKGHFEIYISEYDEICKRWIRYAIEIEHLEVLFGTEAERDNGGKARDFYMSCLLVFRSHNLHVGSITQESMDVLQSFRYQNVLHLINKFPKLTLWFNCPVLSGENIRALYEKINSGHRERSIFEIPLTFEVLQEFLTTFGVRLEKNFSVTSSIDGGGADIVKKYAISVRRKNAISEVVFTHNGNICIFTDDSILVSLQVSENPESYFLSIKAVKNERNHASIDAEHTTDINVALWEYDGNFKLSEVSPDNIRNIYEKMSFCDYGTLFEIHLSFENLQQFLETFGVRLQSNRPQCKYCRENGMCEDSDSESAMESSDADIFAYKSEKVYLFMEDKVLLSFTVTCTESTKLTMKTIENGQHWAIKDNKSMYKVEVASWEYKGEDTPIR
ncbi:hypothetical protein PRIPAC_85083 [Pristionchus pacificus]|uniref:F-box domain-containing protein n=1 Tax=Pristionchus pacificus TaxID=54126 RepID=A0A2A6BMR4_PRIPA|nr:hypothetical protein PRIPAC_85083 [Pristionchus pacificus]|eukprot:PDM67083.1 F-box domain-containing protein [Pristionchus pacificus]